MRYPLLALAIILLVSNKAKAYNEDLEYYDEDSQQFLQKCSSSKNCNAGLFCFSCHKTFKGLKRCVRSSATNPFTLLNNSLPYNKYAYLATHNSFAIEGYPLHTDVQRMTFTNQKDSISKQLANGVRTLLLDTYDFKGDIWLCHSFEGKCHDYTAFGPAVDTLREVEAFLSENPKEIVTIILEDYVHEANGLRRVFTEAGLMKYWLPMSRMPKNGRNWPLVSDMVRKNQRLVVFTSNRSKERSEEIAYQWHYMVENKYGDDGLKPGSCSKRAESSPLNDKKKSLIFINYFGSIPVKESACLLHSTKLIYKLRTCYKAAGNRWGNFLAVDYYKRSAGGGVFQAVDMLNGELLCGSSDVHSCVKP